MDSSRRIFRVTLPSADVAAFLDECDDSEWYAFDTGERVMTDEGPDAEAVLLVELAVRASLRAEAALLH